MSKVIDMLDKPDLKITYGINNKNEFFETDKVFEMIRLAKIEAYEEIESAVIEEVRLADEKDMDSSFVISTIQHYKNKTNIELGVEKHG